ncbi:hypothetical protein ONZ43_g684 [Nemania bipapillata]|uniref:Uncharacterized protein n=1 Tax=Nemania bipapillata TaxID=110536 RepID=A0ACC2J843_9PEZI|nr:hypothetical protein ONZ43_g684 [Nemania bipapillata]
MEIIQASEAFVQGEGDLVFDHKKFILRRTRDNQYFYSRTLKRISSPSATDLEELELIEIPTDHIWPIFKAGLTAAAQPLPSKTYIKRPSLIDYGDTPASYKLSDQILNEAEVCEILMEHPHPNIAHYLGCIVEDGRITGLCFVEYDMTLSEAMKHDISLDKERFLQGIENGVSHLHGLGLIHNDLNPHNIMIQDGNPVIIDFDSCKKEGQELGPKRGTDGWCAEKMDYAIRDNDRYGISKIREFMMKVE